MSSVSPLRQIYHYEPVKDWLGTSGQPTATQFRAIADAGYEAVINLALPDSDHAISSEGSIVSGYGMAYFHIPVEFKAPTVDDLRLFFGVMDALAGRKIWVHCVVNARVSAFVYHYLRHARGLSEEEASSELLRKWRPRMDEVWRNFLEIPKETVRP